MHGQPLYNVHPSLLRMIFLFGWPPCQRSDMTLVEVSQHAYDYLYIRTIVLFVFLRNSCKPDMVLVYILSNKLCLSLSESESERTNCVRLYQELRKKESLVFSAAIYKECVLLYTCANTSNITPPRCFEGINSSDFVRIKYTVTAIISL